MLRIKRDERPKSSDEMTVAELFDNECPNSDLDHSLRANGECIVCGWAPTVQQVEQRRKWMKEHPNGD